VLPRLAALAALIAPASGAACADGSADQIIPPTPLGMSSAMAPYYDDGNLTIYQAARPIVLPVRKPTPAEVSALGPAPSGTPYPRAPFLTVQDESLEVHYTVSNLDDAAHTIWVLIDPWNEFVRWDPGVTIVDDDVTTPNFGYDLSFLVQGKTRVEGTITSDDMVEVATKLASAENVIAHSAEIEAAAMTGNSPGVTDLVNHIFDPQNHANTSDPLYTPWVPPIIAGVTGFDLGLRTLEPANVAVEITIDVQDLEGDRFLVEGSQSSTDKPLGVPPVVLSPPSARF
jgi:hypothetical protein